MFKHYSDQSNNLQFYDYFDKIWDLNVLKKETTINIPLRIYIDNLMIQRPYSFND
jgi:autophagy-related protein 5